MTGKEQVRELMNELLSFAEKMLGEHGEFHPFGGYLKVSGAVVQVGVQLEGTAQQKVAMLVESFKKIAAKSEAVAFGIATNVKLPHDDGSKSDAIKFFLEHQDGYCAEVFFCYELGCENSIEITDTIAQQGQLLFFARPN